MKTFAIAILFMLFFPAVALSVSANGHWDAMIWDHDSWYSSQGVISGQVTTSITGQLSTINGATVVIIETGQTTVTDQNGNFSFTGVQPGIYHIKIIKNNFASLELTGVQVSEGGTTSLPASPLSAPIKGDINDDGKIGIEEAIHALQVISGMK
jgi:hypothetical protein